MTSETGEALGFTLLEILLALGLIALLSAVFIGAASNLLADRPLSVDQEFWKVCAEARKDALQDRHDVRLTFDDKAKAFVIDEGTSSHAFPVTAPGELIVDFISGQKSSSSILIGGTLVETSDISYVSFFNDGTCSPFRAQVRQGTDVHVLAVDPWTCAPLLSPDAKS